MRVLIAPDSFGSTLGPVQAAAAMAQGWATGAPHDDLRLLPLSDGGPGFLDVAREGLTIHLGQAGRAPVPDEDGDDLGPADHDPVRLRIAGRDAQGEWISVEAGPVRHLPLSPYGNCRNG